MYKLKAWCIYRFVTDYCLNDETECSNEPVGRYAQCSSCNKFVRCKRKRRFVGSCDSTNSFFDRVANRCSSDSSVCQGY